MIIKEIPNFPNYVMYEDGNVQNIKTKNFLKMDKKFCYALVNCGKVKRFSIKTLYKLVFNKNFCYDYIEKINDDEVFKDIPGTKGLFQISNYARVKSLKGIYARILKPFLNTKGYYRIDIEYIYPSSHCFKIIYFTKFNISFTRELFFGRVFACNR